MALALGLSACARAPAPPVAVTQPPPLVLDADAVCLQDLATLGVSFQAVESFGDPVQGCGISNAVKVSATGAAWNRPGVVTCAMARTLARYQTDVLQPLAMARFGQSIKRLHHAGTYDCRVRRTDATKVSANLRGSRGGRLSEHSKGQAIDLTAFELADGTMVSVKKDWSGQAAKSAFLRDVAQKSCDMFSVVLTPNYNRVHQDHFHLDLGPYALCGN